MTKIPRARERQQVGVSEHTSIITDEFGIDLAASDMRDLAALRAAFIAAVQAKNRAAWVIGDAYNALAGQDEAELAAVLDGAALSLKTAQNYAAVCSAYPRPLRRVPVSISHYEAAAKLARRDPALALGVLVAAYDGHLEREWVRVEAARRLGRDAESAEVTLVYDAGRGVFVASFAPAWLESGYTRTITILKPS